jgi:biopolymer transport protein ExbB/TolQ
VTRKPERFSIWGTLSSLGWPLIVGLAVCSVFYVLLQGPLQSETMHRYFSAHPVSYFVTAMFFVGFVALVIKLSEVAVQYTSLSRVTLGIPPNDDINLEEIPELLSTVAEWPRTRRESYLGQRLHQVLEFVMRKSSAAGLDEELKYLSDVDAARQQESYSLVRIIIWATPMLGFLGTVIGITHALGDLGAQSELLATDPKTAMQGLLGGLYIAFDTTALALSLTIVLMFFQFVVDRIETQLLEAVDGRVGDELTGRILDDEADLDPHLVIVRRMSEAVLDSTEQLVRQQTEHWRKTMDSANDKWSHLLETSGNQMRDSLTESLGKSIDRLSERMASAERQADEQMRTRWEQWQTALSDNARQLHAQQLEMTRQGEVMTRVLEATGDVIKLEKALNHNLHALAGSKNFEDTVMSLSAAIHLLNVRLGGADRAPLVELVEPDSEGRAA